MAEQCRKGLDALGGLGIAPDESENAHGEEQYGEADDFCDGENFVGIVFRGKHGKGNGDQRGSETEDAYYFCDGAAAWDSHDVWAGRLTLQAN